MNKICKINVNLYVVMDMLYLMLKIAKMEIIFSMMGALIVNINVEKSVKIVISEHV